MLESLFHTYLPLIISSVIFFLIVALLFKLVLKWVGWAAVVAIVLVALGALPFSQVRDAGVEGIKTAHNVVFGLYGEVVLAPFEATREQDQGSDAQADEEEKGDAEEVVDFVLGH